jgi:hypothetical protein
MGGTSGGVDMRIASGFWREYAHRRHSQDHLRAAGHGRPAGQPRASGQRETSQRETSRRETGRRETGG